MLQASAIRYGYLSNREKYLPKCILEGKMGKKDKRERKELKVETQRYLKYTLMFIRKLIGLSFALWQFYM